MYYSRNLAKYCLATHLPWIILFDRQVKYFSFLILLLLLAGKVSIHAVHWEALRWECLIEASAEFDPVMQERRLEKKTEDWKQNTLGPRESRRGKSTETETRQSKNVNSFWLTLWLPVGGVHLPSRQLWRAHQSSSMFPAQPHEASKMESSGAAHAPGPKVEASPSDSFWHYSVKA